MTTFSPLRTPLFAALCTLAGSRDERGVVPGYADGRAERGSNRDIMPHTMGCAKGCVGRVAQGGAWGCDAAECTRTSISRCSVFYPPSTGGEGGGGAFRAA